MMNKIIILSLLFFISLSVWSAPIPTKSKHTVIIDTDCAIDDMRAISLLLSRPEISIKAILLSDGSLPPNDGFEKVSSLLHEFNCDSIPIASGETLKGINPPWRPFVKQISWGSAIGQQRPGLNATSLLYEKLSQSNEKVTMICLGALTNISQVIKKEATIASKIERIIWYNESIKPVQGFNYECDKSSADFLFKSGIRMDVISNLKKKEAILDTSFYAVCKLSNNKLSHVLFNTFSQPAVFERLSQHHFRLCDDLIAIYITNPELFDINTLKDNFKIRYNQDYNATSVKEAIDDMIKGTYVASKSIVFNDFPRKREMFTYDVREIMDSAIAKYGLDEWKANVMTDEFHGHLGVFSIVGAKMGIKAREIFGAAPDQLEVMTFAGTKPPYSCLNDGIQVSTGATLGMGTIQVSHDSIKIPSAIFTFKGRSIQIILKKEYLEKVDADINEGIVKFGLMDDGYWKLIRRNAITYWLNWDRNEIFDIKEITNK
jgi:inosine-uridine nucleoside N-ribohydrolase/formylmethanofuran dehydrogenase subunit E